MSAPDPTLDDCNCCDAEPSRVAIANPPGQPALAYRAGTYAAFLQHMLARLPRHTISDGPNRGVRPLAALTTRSSDDPAIAICHGAATVLDVLTFYTERIVNEGFLRTATERRSILELARAIGYELSPGVAASAFLAFTVESAAGAPGHATVPTGTRVQSMPGQDELPQTFETVEELEARAEWNQLRLRVTQLQRLAVEDGKLMLAAEDGTSSEARQLFLKGTDLGLRSGDHLLVARRSKRSGPLGTSIVQVRDIEVDIEGGRTIADLAPTRSLPPFSKLALGLTKKATKTLGFNEANLTHFVLEQSLNESELGSLMAMNAWSPAQMIDMAKALKPKAAVGRSGDEGVFAFRTRAAFFGHNAPSFTTLPDPKPIAPDWESEVTSIWTTSDGTLYPGGSVFLERAVPEGIAESWALFTAGALKQAYWVTDVREQSRADFALSGRATRLRLRLPDGKELPASKDDRANFRLRESTAFVQSERLELAELDIEEPVNAGDSELMLDGLVPGIQKGRPLALSGERADAKSVTAHEILVVSDVVHVHGYTTLRFATGLRHSYLRRTVVLNLNVARATHGETVREVLRGADDARNASRYVLKKPPLTHVSAPTEGGSESTLEVRVNDVLWREVPTFYGHGPSDQVFVTRNDNDGRTTVAIGDGDEGARLPAANVVATYRSGTGPQGQVAAGALTLLQTRPLGIREVTNPLPATGAAAPERLDEARRNAPLTVLTLDRIVSLRDFENFSRAFAGITKAAAIALWSGESRVVHITVAAAEGEPLDHSSDLYRNLVRAIDAARDPTPQVLVDSYQLLLFDLAARVLVDPSRTRERVQEDVAAALADEFSFARRELGQGVTAAEVLTVIQTVEGVVAADIDRLYLVTDPTGPAQTVPALTLLASSARWEGGEVRPAELLLLNPAGLTLTELPT